MDTYHATSAGGTFSNRIRKVSSGVITTVAGGGSSLGEDVPATSAYLNPIGLAVSRTGDLYIYDASGLVRKVSNGVINTIAGNGTYGFSGDGGPATRLSLALFLITTRAGGSPWTPPEMSTLQIRSINGFAF